MTPLEQLKNATKIADDLMATHKPLILRLNITPAGVTVEGRWLLAGGYHGAVDHITAVPWQDIERGAIDVLALALRKVANALAEKVNASFALPIPDPDKL